MREGELTYDDFLRRLNIQDVLIDAGYHLNRRDGLRYPSYVRLDSEGRRIRNDKFIVTQQGKCCFKPQQQKSYNIISFIKEHPHFFAEYTPGMSKDRLVNLVCNRLLNQPITERNTRVLNPEKQNKPFNANDYEWQGFDLGNWETPEEILSLLQEPWDRPRHPTAVCQRHLPDHEATDGRQAIYQPLVSFDLTGQAG